MTYREVISVCPGFDIKRKCLVQAEVEFLGTFAKLQKSTINFVTTVRLLSVRIELGSHWTDFHGNRYSRSFRKSVEKTQISLTFDKNNGYLTRSLMYIYDISCSVLLRMTKVSDKNQNTHIIFNTLRGFDSR